MSTLVEAAAAQRVCHTRTRCRARSARVDATRPRHARASGARCGRRPRCSCWGPKSAASRQAWAKRGQIQRSSRPRTRQRRSSPCSACPPTLERRDTPAPPAQQRTARCGRQARGCSRRSRNGQCGSKHTASPLPSRRRPRCPPRSPRARSLWARAAKARWSTSPPPCTATGCAYVRLSV